MGFYVFYIGALIIYNLIKRVEAIKTRQIDLRYYKTYANKDGVPEELAVLERHVDNQFQVPTIFLVSCTAHLALHQVSTLTVALAWLFVVFRLAHSYIHLGSNVVLRRAKVYGLGWLALLGLWMELIFAVSA